MLAIRLQRVGRKGYPVYRLAVQEAQRHPSSGRVVAYVGSYNPHTKEATIQNEAAQKYLDNGAQPTPRVMKLFESAGVTLPNWVKKPAGDKQKSLKNAAKLRRNQPKEEAAAEEPAPPETSDQEVPAEETPAEEPSEDSASATSEAEATTDEAVTEVPEPETTPDEVVDE